MKKSLEQYRTEFDEFLYSDIYSKEHILILNKWEKLAQECISNYPDEEMGYKEWGEALSNYFLLNKDCSADIRHILELSKSNLKYILTLENFFQFPNVMNDEFNIPTEDRNFINVWKFAAENDIQTNWFSDAAKQVKVACKLGVDYKEFVTRLNPPLKKLSINNFLCIEEIEIENIEKNKEIYFLGENGVGKTALLQAIVLGLVEADEETEEIIFSQIGIPSEFRQREHRINLSVENGSLNGYLNIFAYGTSRSRSGLENDDYFDKYGCLTLFNRNLLLTDVESWLKDVQRKEFLNKSSIPLNQILELLKDIVNFGNDEELKIEYDSDEDKFLFIEKGTKTKFEHLADGYRSVLIWLCDLLYRLTKNQPYIKELKDFYGIVLVDEIDMFLHPKWEYTIVKKLREKLPNIQWFFTTHSPMLILGASPDAVFYKLYKENGKTKISEQWQCKDIDNLLANAILTSPLFDLETARMRAFDQTQHQIDTNENYWYSRIEKVIKEERNQQKNKGKAYFSEDEINDIVKNAIAQLKKGGVQ